MNRCASSSRLLSLQLHYASYPAVVKRRQPWLRNTCNATHSFVISERANLMHLVTYMRISVTDRCNERCAYCMPHDVAIEWLPRGQILTYEEILRVARVATSLGVTKFRVTGGEPLVRKNVADFIAELNKLPGVTDIGLSTNATLLAPLAEKLPAAGARKFNISLDTPHAYLYHEL